MPKRVLAVIFGIVLFLAGASAAVAGGALMLIFGSDSTLSSNGVPLTTRTTALVASMDDIKDARGFAAAVGQPTLRLSVNGTGRDVFIGVGPADAVDKYLAGASIDRVTDLEVDPFKLKTTPRDGSGTPAPPRAQTFWTADASGSNASFNWKISDGSHRLVVMNADASPGVNATGSVGLHVPNLFAIGLGTLIGGVVIGLIGLTLFIIGVRTRQNPPPGPPNAAYPGAPGYPPAAPRDQAAPL